MPGQNKLIDYIKKVAEHSQQMTAEISAKEDYLETMAQAIPALVSEHSIDLSMQDDTGKTALIYACELGLEPIVEMLLSWDSIIYFNDPYLAALDLEGNNALTKAIALEDREEKTDNTDILAHRSIVEKLSQHDCSFQMSTKDMQDKLIKTAIASENLWFLRHCIGAKHICDEKNSAIILQVAMRSKELSTITFWIQSIAKYSPSVLQNKNVLVSSIHNTFRSDCSGKLAKQVLDKLKKYPTLIPISYADIYTQQITEVIAGNQYEELLKPLWLFISENATNELFQPVMNQFLREFSARLHKATELVDIDHMTRMMNFFSQPGLSQFFPTFSNEFILKIANEVKKNDDENSNDLTKLGALMAFIEAHRLAESYAIILCQYLREGKMARAVVYADLVLKSTINDSSSIAGPYIREALTLLASTDEFELLLKILRISPLFFSAEGFPFVCDVESKSLNKSFLMTLIAIRDAQQIEDTREICLALSDLDEKYHPYLSEFFTENPTKSSAFKTATLQIKRSKESALKEFQPSEEKLNTPVLYKWVDDENSGAEAISRKVFEYMQELGVRVLNCDPKNENVIASSISIVLRKHCGLARLHARNEQGRTLLSYACEFGNYLAVEKIMELSAYHSAIYHHSEFAESLKYAIAFEDLYVGDSFESNPTLSLRILRRRQIVDSLFNMVNTDSDLLESLAEIAYDNKNFRYLLLHLRSTIFFKQNFVNILSRFPTMPGECFISFVVSPSLSEIFLPNHFSLAVEPIVDYFKKIKKQVNIFDFIKKNPQYNGWVNGHAEQRLILMDLCNAILYSNPLSFGKSNHITGNRLELFLFFLKEFSCAALLNLVRTHFSAPEMCIFLGHSLDYFKKNPIDPADFSSVLVFQKVLMAVSADGYGITKEHLKDLRDFIKELLIRQSNAGIPITLAKGFFEFVSKDSVDPMIIRGKGWSLQGFSLFTVTNQLPAITENPDKLASDSLTEKKLGG